MTHLGADLRVFPFKTHLAKIHETPLTKVHRNFWVPHKITEHHCLSGAYIPYFFNKLVLNCRVLINLLDKIRQI